VLGWPVFMAMVIVTANVWGFITGEWKGASRKARSYSVTGIAILVAAIVVISQGH
jgi:L-rhamnose-H+ transport protein